MATIPKNPNFDIEMLVDAYHESFQERPRPYMGVSMLGHHCERYMWLMFHWAVIEKFPGRILRLFRRGQMEEETIVADLRAIGCTVEECIEDQKLLDFGCHVKGHPDGIVKGLPEAPKTWHILEAKTHNARSFAELQTKGVMDAKFMHYVQMQVYMSGHQLDRALYYAVCKDDDHIEATRIELDRELAHYYIARGKRVALESRIPAPISTDPTWYQCRFCPMHDFCHVNHKVKEINCRTCAHSTAKEDGTWFCERWGDTIPLESQYQGCESHVLHPDLVPYELDMKSDLGGEHSAVYIIDGKPVVNGEDGYSSKEIIAGGPFGDAIIDMARRVFNGRIINESN